MRLTKSVVGIAVVDCIVFLASLFYRSYRAYVHLPASGGVNVLYWLTAFVGLVLAILGFWKVTRGKREEFRRSIVCILFSMIPGCVGIVALLSATGTHPV